MLRYHAVSMLAAAVFIAAAVSCRADAYPASDDMRRLAAEIIVMRGDAERLAGAKDLSEREKKALADRVRGAAAFLPVLLRRASDERKGGEIVALRSALADDDWQRVAVILRVFGTRFRFDDTGLILDESTPEAVKLGEEIHQTYCSGCHDGGDPEQWLPTPDLSVLAKKLTRNDLAARFFNGIRGDRSTAIAQPMSAGDIAALIAYYRQKQPLED